MQNLFIAVQCFQCSTMQVKQQKKSNNKWTCVVCNEKQSVRKVFAQGSLAKDVRKFVQSFNMSRQIAEETLSSPTGEIDEHHRIGEDHRAECQRKRRGDWSEYLDSAVEDDCIREGEANYGEGSVLEPKIVTELSKELFKKPKLTNSYSVGLNKFGESKSFRPTFSNRKTNKAIISQENKESVKSQPTAMAQQSKWSHYLIQEDDSDLFLGPGDSPPGAFETRAYDQRVEDDIHPDFI